MNVLFALIMSWMSFASAAESIGKVNCYTLNRPVSHMIHADIIGTRSDKEWTVEYANINLTSYNWSTHVETAVLRFYSLDGGTLSKVQKFHKLSRRSL